MSTDIAPEAGLLCTIPSDNPLSVRVDRLTALLICHARGVEAVPLEPGKGVVIGRCPSSDVALRDPNLSRRHARFEIVDDEVWLEDLGSTNGTRLNGVRVGRSKVRPDDTVTLGGVTVVVHSPSPAESNLDGLCSHDLFLSLLKHEIVRHRSFRRRLGLIMVQAIGAQQEPLVRWLPRARCALRPVDCAGLYSPTAVQILVPETSEDELRAVVDAIVTPGGESRQALVCGVALYPEAASTNDGLMEAARVAAQQATPGEPVRFATAGGTRREGTVKAIVCSPAMQEVYAAVERLARAEIPVLICGETGTGKELVARAIHERSARREKPQRFVNCAAIPAQLVESTMFGHERGAFTGAVQRTNGVFQEADGGTVLLDEIGELSAAAQATLLRTLETRRVSRVGSTEEIEVDVRILAATHRNLEAMCEEGTFRWDLLFRINAMILKIPPLRARQEEIEPMARSFLAEAAEANAIEPKEIGADVLGLLQRHRWPGNVRELRNVMHRAAVMAEGSTITVEDLPEEIRALGQSLDDDQQVQFKTRVQRFEVNLIQEMLEETGWNQTRAAKALGIPLRTLTHKIKALNIRPGAQTRSV